jgi:hypothetical protein
VRRLKSPSHATVVAYLALFVSLGASSYAAVKINGKNIKNGTIAGKKLKKNTLGAAQVNESKLGKVGSAGKADSAGTAGSTASATRAASAASADNATNANNALTAQTAQTLGSFGPDVFARASQIEVRGPFETDPATGTDQDFFSFPEIDFAVKTPRAPNAPGINGLVELQHSDASKRVILHVRNALFEDASEFLEGGGGINFAVNQTGGGNDNKDFLDLTVVSLTSNFTARIECVADDSVANIPVTCVAFKNKP